jgi:hypothetical protein
MSWGCVSDDRREWIDFVFEQEFELRRHLGSRFAPEALKSRDLARVVESELIHRYRGTDSEDVVVPKEMLCHAKGS